MDCSVGSNRHRWYRHGQIGLLIAMVCFAQGGCRALSPKSIDARQCYDCDSLRDTTYPIQRGEDRPVLDAVGWVIGIPGKIVLWNRKVDNHSIGPATEMAIRDYLYTNHLDSVRVRLNQYRPGEDWSRLVKNKSVAAPWRYTFGTLTVLGETILPGRLFGGDHFNPYTNTIHIYSDIPAVALHEAAHAKDFARRKYKGTYAAAYVLPVVPLYHESLASRDVMAYLEQTGSRDQQAAAARILYPAYGTYVSSAAGTFVPKYADPIYIASVVGGHVAGRWQASKIMASAERSSYPTSNYLVRNPSKSVRTDGFESASDAVANLQSSLTEVQSGGYPQGQMVRPVVKAASAEKVPQG